MPSGKSQGPPNLSLDVNEPEAWLRFNAALAWEGDPSKLNQTLSTFSAKIMGSLRNQWSTGDTPRDLRAMARKMNISEDNLARMPQVQKYYLPFFTQPLRTFLRLRRKVFAPAGHYGAVADAPGAERLTEDFELACRQAGKCAGTLLSLVAILDRHHPGVPATLNRAIAIMQSWSTRGLTDVPVDRTIKTYWLRWRHVAPLWASSIGNVQQAQACELPSFEATLEFLHDPVRLQTMVAHAKWFRSFATSHVSENAKYPIIPDLEAMRIIADVAERSPPLAPLSDADLEAAKRYRAPTNKYDP